MASIPASVASSGTAHISILSPQKHEPKAISRFASPSCPWPWAGDSEADGWLDELLAANLDSSRASSLLQSFSSTDHVFSTNGWEEYPGQLFPNWTRSVQTRCGMQTLFHATNAATCGIYHIDLGSDNKLHPRPTIMEGLLQTTNSVAKFLDGQREVDSKMRCMFVENLSGSVLKMLGTHFRIEPFFFSSAINRIPARYHEPLPEQHGDHMYITLPFLRVSKSSAASDKIPGFTGPVEKDIFAPLELIGEDKTLKVTLQQEMLAVLVVRAEGHHTLITVHPEAQTGADPAYKLARRFLAAGRGVYWGNLISQSYDPVFMLLLVVWSASYAWDEAMGELNKHVAHLEARSQRHTLKDIEEVSPQVHTIRAPLLWYDDLLDQFKKSLEFIKKMGPVKTLDDEKRTLATERLKQEIKTLMNAVQRLHGQQKMLDKRLIQIMKRMDSTHNLLQSESMKKIAYLTMIYLPATLIATVFGMNVKDLVPGSNGTIVEYAAAMVGLTMLTIWLAGIMTVRVQRPDIRIAALVCWPLVTLQESAVAFLQWTRDQVHVARGNHNAQGVSLPERPTLHRSLVSNPPSASIQANSRPLRNLQKPNSTTPFDGTRPESCAASLTSQHVGLPSTTGTAPTSSSQSSIPHFPRPTINLEVATLRGDPGEGDHVWSDASTRVPTPVY